MNKPITIDANIRFGVPCVTGTGVCTERISSRFVAGDPVKTIANDLGISSPQVEAALRFELSTPTEKRRMLHIVENPLRQRDGRMIELNMRTLRWKFCK